MLELYHGTTSVCAQKARLALAEKGLAFDSHLLKLNGDQFAPEYLKLNPNGVVPTLVHDGNVVVESTVVMHYVDDVFPDPPLMPAAPLDRARARMFTKLMDEYIHHACILYTFATSNRAPLAALSKDERESAFAKSPLTRHTDFKRAAVEQGFDSPHGREATKSFAKLLKWIEESMARGKWLAGDRYSVADIAATPYIWRLDMIKLSRLWDDKPGVADWYERIRARPNFETAVNAWLTDADRAKYRDLADPWPDVTRVLAAA